MTSPESKQSVTVVLIPTTVRPVSSSRDSCANKGSPEIPRASIVGEGSTKTCRPGCTSAPGRYCLAVPRSTSICSACKQPPSTIARTPTITKLVLFICILCLWPRTYSTATRGAEITMNDVGFDGNYAGVNQRAPTCRQNMCQADDNDRRHCEVAVNSMR